MFGIGMPEMILILAVALIVIGPKKLPDLAKSIGRALGEFRKATSEIKESIDLGDEISRVKKRSSHEDHGLSDLIDSALKPEPNGPITPQYSAVHPQPIDPEDVAPAEPERPGHPEKAKNDERG